MTIRTAARIRRVTTTFLTPLAFLLITGALPATAQPSASRPLKDYRLELEVSLVGDSSLIERLGTMTLTVFPQGVHLDSLWLDGYSKTGSSQVVLVKPLARVYALMPVEGFRNVVRRMSGESGELQPDFRTPVVESPVSGRIGEIPAERHRIRLGKQAWIDVWTSKTIPRNLQLEKLSREILAAVSSNAVPLADQIRGVPLFIQMSSPNHPKETILRLRSIRRSSAGAADMLDTGRFFLRVSAAERLWND